MLSAFFGGILRVKTCMRLKVAVTQDCCSMSHFPVNLECLVEAHPYGGSFVVPHPHTYLAVFAWQVQRMAF